MAKQNNKTKGKKRSVIGVLASAFLALCFLVGLIAFFIIRASSAGQIGTVNGALVHSGELAMYAAGLRAATGAEIAVANGIDSYGESFWDTEFSGATPRQALYEKALAALVRDKIIQQAAAQRGITAPGSWNEVEKALAARNAGGGAADIYGPEEYGVAEYHSYLMTDAITDLKTHLLENELAPTEEQKREAFYTLPDALRSTTFSVDALRIWVPGDIDTGLAVSQLEAAFAEYGEGIAAIEVVSAALPGLSGEAFSLDSEEIHREDITQQALAEELAGSAKGEWVIASDGHLYYLTGTQGGELLAYEDAPWMGETAYINAAFEDYIDELVMQAKVEMNKNAINALDDIV